MLTACCSYMQVSAWTTPSYLTDEFKYSAAHWH